MEAANCKVPMGVLSEQMAKERNITRASQDAFAARSYQKAIEAQKAGLFNEEIVPLDVKWTDPKSGEEKTITVKADDGVRQGITAESLGRFALPSPRTAPSTPVTPLRSPTVLPPFCS